jgi:hypothetical protein
MMRRWAAIFLLLGVLGCAKETPVMNGPRYFIPDPEVFMFYGFYQNPQLVYWSVI